MTFQRLDFSFLLFFYPFLLFNSLLAVKEQKQNLHEALCWVLCGSITLLLVQVQNQQHTR